MTSSVLIVDDNPGNMKLLSYLLVRHGYEVRTATDAEEALQVLRDFHPRLVLMDLQMPKIDGFELTRRLRAAPPYPGMIILAVTASAMKGDREKALAAGCDGYVTKPVDTRKLPQILASYLEGSPEK